MEKTNNSTNLTETNEINNIIHSFFHDYIPIVSNKTTILNSTNNDFSKNIPVTKSTLSVQNFTSNNLVSTLIVSVLSLYNSTTYSSQFSLSKNISTQRESNFCANNNSTSRPIPMHSFSNKKLIHTSCTTTTKYMRDDNTVKKSTTVNLKNDSEIQYIYISSTKYPLSHILWYKHKTVKY